MNRRIATGAFLALSLITCASSLDAQQTNKSLSKGGSQAALLQVYRGSVPNWSPVWIELADLGSGRFALTVLDGLTNSTGAPEVFIMQTNGRSGSACRLRAVGGAKVSLSQCPSGNAISLEAELMNISGRVTMVPVGAGAAFGYGAKGRKGSVASYDASCAMGRLARADIFPSGGPAQSGAALKQAISGLRQQAADAEELGRLRSDRASAINVLAYTSAELEQLAYIDGKINRIMDFRYRGPFIEQRRQLEEQFANRPDRLAARNRIQQIDRGLARIYAPAGQARAGAAADAASLAAMMDTLDRAIAQDLRGQTRSSALQVIEAERALAELEQCATLVGLSGYQFAAKRDLADQFGRIAPGFGKVLDSDFARGETSTAMRARLQDYRGSPGLMAALEGSGAAGVLASADSRVTALAAKETQERDAAARRAAQAEARLRQAAAAQQPARKAPAPASRPAASAPRGAPSARQIRDALVYENTYGRVTVGAAMGLAESSADYDAGVSRVKTLGVTFEVSYTVDNPQCRSVGRGKYRCTFVFGMNNSLGIPFSGPGAHTFELRDGIWRSPTYLAALIEGGDRAATNNNDRFCTVQGFGTPEGASIRDQNGLPC